MPRRWLASTDKAERLLGFRATIPLEQGLADLVKWWRAERGSIRDGPATRGGRLVIPIAMPVLADEEAEAAREAVLSAGSHKVRRLPPSSATSRPWSARPLLAQYPIAPPPCTSP